MDHAYHRWDDGAADILLVPSLSAQIFDLASGPLIVVGWSLWNAGGVACNVRLLDGAAGQFYQTSIGITNKDVQPWVSSGIRIETSLRINVVGAGPVNGAIFIRRKDPRVLREEPSPLTSTATTRPSQPGPSQPSQPR